MNAKTKVLVSSLLVSFLPGLANAESPSAAVATSNSQRVAPAEPDTTAGDFGMQLIFQSIDSPIARIKAKAQLVKQAAPGWMKSGGDAAQFQSLMDQVSQAGKKHHFEEAEKTLDTVLSLIGAHYTPAENDAENFHRQDRESFIADVKRMHVDGVEEYMGWSVVAREQGPWNWSMYREDAAAIKKAGARLVAYLWAQALPKWVTNDPRYVFASNVGTGLATEDLSIYAPETLAFYDRYYGEASRELGDLIDVVRIGSPYDYGECAYPAGAGSAQFPKKNLGSRFWVNEAPARAHFRKTMQGRYGTVDKLNAAWGTHFPSFDTIDYPKDPRSARSWLDFIHWYQDGLTERMGELVAVAQKHFPKTPVSINIGWPYEKINLGFDISGLTKMAAEKGICLRTPTGEHVPFLFTKRVATAARFYQPARFSSEPVGASAPQEQIALTYFKDLTTGVTWHMDYRANFERGPDFLAEFRKLWLRAEYPRIDTALFFPTTAHFLDDWDNWRQPGFSGGFPEGLQDYAEDLRDRLDYDVVDERLVAGGFLSSYHFLLWPVGKVAEAETLQKIKAWVENGGTLLVANLENIQTVEKDHGAFEALARLPATNGVRQIGRGKVIQIGGKVSDLDAAFPGQLDARDGVLVSAFKEGTLVFNRTDQPVVKKITVKGVPTELTLAPLESRWIGGQ